MFGLKSEPRVRLSKDSLNARTECKRLAPTEEIKDINSEHLLDRNETLFAAQILTLAWSLFLCQWPPRWLEDVEVRAASALSAKIVKIAKLGYSNCDDAYS